MITSRRFVVLALLAATAPLSGRLRRRVEGRGDRQDLAARLGSVVKQRHSAAVVGGHYIAATGGMRAGATADLAAAIAEDLTLAPNQLSALNEKALKSLIHRRIRRDFETENVVKVKGWMLSRTEARLCALAALT